MRKFIIINALAALLLALSAHSHAQDAVLDRARQLIDQKQFAAAFALLDPLEEKRAGEPEYDFLLGIAAIDAGQLTRAVFALERVLAARPDDARARAEIARAYFIMGEGENAKREFAAVKAQKPPAEVVSTIDRFLATLDIRGDRPPTDREGFTGFIEAGTGHDSNANSATSTGSIAIPLFPGAIFNLGAGSTSRSDTFLTLAAGLNGRKFLSPTMTLFGTASVDQRINSTVDRADTGSLNGTLGVSWDKDGHEVSLAAQGQTFEVDNTRFRNSFGAILQWKHNFSALDQITSYVQRTRLWYPAQRTRDADRTALGVALAHAFDHPAAPVVFLSGYGGSEDERSPGVPQFGHRFAGGRIGGQFEISKGLALSANLTFEDRRYGGPDPLFLVNRKDKDYGLRLAMPWDVAPLWVLTPQLTFNDNRSNVATSDYTRKQLFVTLRRDFR